MSRCFPFLPEAYVKKPRAEDVDSLKKEKEREKKHRKDRRDKEKRESKEKKEKERSEGKHRDKKDKKEKHLDKKKDRDKDKEKEKKREREKDRGGTSEERSLSEQQTDGGNSKEKVFDKGRPPGKIPGVSGAMDKEKSITHLPDIRRGGGRSANHIAAPKSIEKNHNIQKNQNNRAVHNLAVHNPVDAKFVAELGKRVRDEGAAAQSSEKISVNGQKKDEGLVRLINASSGPSADRKERSQERRSDDRRLSAQGVKDTKEIGGAVASQNFSISIQMSKGMPRPPKMSVGEKMAGMEKIREKESKHMGSDKHVVLDLQRSKTSGKDKDWDREKRKGERTKEAENKVYNKEKLRERAKDNLDATDANNIVLHFLEVNKIVPSMLNDKKRKTLEPNGFLHENETRQIKLPRQLSPPSHPSSVENGKILDGPQSMDQHLLPGRQLHLDSVKVDKPKKHKPNGIPEKKPDLVPSMLDEASLELVVEKAMARSPHPDLKYLDKVLTVPKLEDLIPPDEDEEWLFDSRHELQKQREVHSDKIKDTTPQVWSEAMPLDSADIIALPYVVPF
ncbi:hypothetical protein MLD38_035725 [Melastoma candidum]|uniref:Uncharacterized protein n=1 Tax=Melastoma candidum TaxID=119954 RepID=A0ACB9LJC8_9MYRT|nr:hypothetical protein MLD38_035725 [Melastoma candidum]